MESRLKSDYLSDEEQSERLQRWWGENWKSLVGSVLLAIVAVVGWNEYQSYTNAQAQSAAKGVSSRSSMHALPGSPLKICCPKIYNEHSKTSYQKFSLLYRAKDAVTETHWEAALGYLEISPISLTNDPKLLDLVRLRKARVQFQLGEFYETLATLGEIKGVGV
ncbi:MAG: hypothetical protein Ct9H300mP8_05140 [Gammaproteobacteria bacterium]|nr:MAG: hypothetical protein Ct9H300mP8_05140 [Gammaproteobacteria bacterium]